MNKVLPLMLSLLVSIMFLTTASFGNNSSENLCLDGDTPEFMDMCLTAPNIMCPSTYLGCPSDNVGTSNTGTATATPGDASCPNPIVSHMDVVTTNTNCLKVIHRTWEATYPPGTASIKLHASCQQVIYLEDTGAPVINNCPSNMTIDRANNCSGTANWSVPTASDDCNLTSFSTTHFSGTDFPDGTTTVTYTANDACGQQSLCSFTVSVSGTCCSGPSIVCPPNFFGCPSESTDVSVRGTASGTNMDASCGTVTVSHVDNVINNGPAGCGISLQRTWTATESGTNNTVSCVQTINTIDDRRPVISNKPGDMTLTGNGAGCSVVVDWTEPTVTDNCGLSSFTSTHSSGTSFPRGTTLVTYTAVDNCGNQATSAFQIYVICNLPCTSPPSISCPATYNGCPTNGVPGPNVTGQATATSSSNCGTPVVTMNDVMTNSGTCSSSKVIQRTWTATNPTNSSLTSSCTQMINLVDNTPPTFTRQCPNSMTLTATGNNCTAVATWTIPSASDNCSSGTIVPQATANGAAISSGSSFSQGSTLVTYTATDACGNDATCAFTVTVNCQTCNTNPTIQCPTNRTVCINANTNPAGLGSATANGGAFCPSPVVNHTDVVTSTGPCAGEQEIQRTWTATYPGVTGLSASCVQIISVKDTGSPVISNCPANLTSTSVSTPVSWIAPTATDACGTVNLTSTHNPGTLFPNGVTTVTYTATDNCGNASVCTFTVTINAPQGGLDNCPNDIVLQCGTNGGAVAHWTPPTYNGVCNVCDDGSHIPGFIYMGSYGGSQYYCSLSPATWPTAKLACESYGGHLADVNSRGENDYLAQQLTIQSAWIGLTDVNSEGNFEWCSGEDLDYTNWYQGQPNNYNNDQDYCEMLNNGQWNDQYNSYSLEYIMEIPCTKVRQTAGPQPGTFLQTGKYTVTYSVNDACGAFATCSFDITVNSGLNITCPNNITVTANDNSGAVVNWNRPYANSCCSSCNAGGANIAGFIYMGSYNGSYYYCSLNAATWATAQATCEANGGHLAVLNNANENNYVASLLPLQSAWIGGSDAANENSFTWVNGDSFNYTNWYPGQPNDYNGNQDCLELLNNGKWNDQLCGVKLEYVMEISQCITYTQTSGPRSGTLLTVGTHQVNYQVSDGCGNTKTCGFSVTVRPPVAPPPSSGYCTSAGANSTHHYIQGVGFGQISNVSGNNGGYHDFTNHCSDVSAGRSYPLQLVPGFGGYSPTKVYWTVWIDYNMDGDFHDNYEFVAYGCGTKALSGSVTIPYNVWNGETVMRVIMHQGGYITDPCQAYHYGETEDYCVVISNANDFSGKDGNEVTSRNNIFSDAAELASALSGELTVYPNPVSQILNIEIPDAETVESMNLYDMSGRILFSNTDVSDENQINVSTLDSGIYMLKVIRKDGQIEAERIIVQK